MSKRVYGCLRDKPDPRDLIYRPKVQRLPQNVDLRAKMPPVWDQGSLGSCTAFGLSGALAFLHGFDPSKLFLYYKERVLEHTTQEDAGAEIRDGIKVLAKCGVPPEELWPYDISKFAKRPPLKAYKAAKQELITAYHRLTSLVDYLDCLASGSPFVIGITVYESFESEKVAETGIVPMPRIDEQILGGHAICVVGYEPGVFIVRNSWGAGWGQSGYFTIPQAYLADPTMANDAWVITACPQ